MVTLVLVVSSLPFVPSAGEAGKVRGARGRGCGQGGRARGEGGKVVKGEGERMKS